MIEVGMHEAKTRLSELVNLAIQGEKVCLTNRGKIVAEIRPVITENKQAVKDEIRRLKSKPLGKFSEIMQWRREGLK